MNQQGGYLFEPGSMGGRAVRRYDQFRQEHPLADLGLQLVPVVGTIPSYFSNMDKGNSTDAALDAAGMLPGVGTIKAMNKLRKTPVSAIRSPLERLGGVVGSAADIAGVGVAAPAAWQMAENFSPAVRDIGAITRAAVEDPKRTYNTVRQMIL